MNYKVETIPNFDRELKRLAKKYSSLKGDVGALGQLLEENPDQGTAIGKNCYKIRMAIKSKGHYYQGAHG
jgi:mRNA-degrading endonuclease RelE of RelBE toxin-antitoxin system